jgi:hypothetical protein
MLYSVILTKPYNGISAGYETSLPKEIAEQLIKEGKAVELPTAKSPKIEQIKKGK